MSNSTQRQGQPTAGQGNDSPLSVPVQIPALQGQDGARGRAVCASDTLAAALGKAKRPPRPAETPGVSLPGDAVGTDGCGMGRLWDRTAAALGTATALGKASARAGTGWGPHPCPHPHPIPILIPVPVPVPHLLECSAAIS